MEKYVIFESSSVEIEKLKGRGVEISLSDLHWILHMAQLGLLEQKRLGVSGDEWLHLINDVILEIRDLVFKD